jgi:hypothetical protein
MFTHLGIGGKQEKRVHLRVLTFVEVRGSAWRCVFVAVNCDRRAEAGCKRRFSRLPSNHTSGVESRG